MKHQSNSTTSTENNRGRSFGFKALTIAGIAAAAALIAAPAASAATPIHRTGQRVQQRVGSSFATDTLNNLTPFPITMTQDSTSGNWADNGNGAPSEHKLFPGYTSDWSVDPSEGSQDFTVAYQFTDATGATNTVTTSLTGSGRYSTGTAACTVTGPDAADWTCDHSTSWWSGDITFSLHGSGSELNLSQANKDAFAQALSTMCDGPNSANKQASCHFEYTADPTYQLSLTGHVPPQAKTLPGCSMKGNSATYTQEDGITTGTSYDNQIGTSASAGVDGLVTASISQNQTWGKSWTSSTEYSYAQPMHADYYYIATPMWFPNIGTFTGNFTATLDGTTYHLNGVQIIGTGVAGGGHGSYVTSQTQTKMTTAQYNAWCGNANTAR